MRSPEEQRQNLAQAILNVRSQRATSRRTLADVMHLSPTTAGFYVDQLIESGYLRESGLEQGAMGRPKRCLGTIDGAGWFAGVEFNADRVQTVRVDFSGRLAGSEVRPLPEDADTPQVMAAIKGLIADLMRGARGPLLGIGLGAPGVVDPLRGVGVEYAFLPDWKEVPVAAQLGKRFKVPVTLENNLRAIALAERWFGGGRNLDDYVIFGPRSGFGVAMMHDGRLFGGANHAAGEIGRWSWPFKSKTCELHDALTSPAVWRRLKEVGERTRLPSDLRLALVEFADSKSDVREEIVRDYAQVIGCLQLLLDTQAYFLHGPLSALGQRFCDDIVHAAMAMMPALKSHPPRLYLSTLGDDAGALGAASLMMEAWMPKNLKQAAP